MLGCSSFTFGAEDNTQFLSRTMDFSMYTDSGVVIVPRNFEMEVRQNELRKGKYAFLGMAAYKLQFPIFYDGINEKGVAGATLYYPGFATYTEKKDARGGVNPLRVVSYILANAGSLDEAIALFETIEIINESNSILGVVPPLHYIFSDSTGRSIIVEPDPDGIKIHQDTIGVMTNSPNYEWHEANLRNYIGVNPRSKEPIQTSTKTFSPFGQGSGTFGLPGDYTPSSRFLRTAYMKFYASEPKNEIEGVTQIFHMLAPVEVPKGAVIHQNGHNDYSVYMTAMCTTSLRYYFCEYDNRRIKCVSLHQADLSNEKLEIFPLTMKQEIDFLNAD